MICWQDALLLFGSIILGLSLWPTIAGPNKPALKTSAIQTVILGSYFVAYLTLSLWGAAIGIAVNTLGWAVVLGQSMRARRNK